MMTTQQMATMNLIETTARACNIGAGFPSNMRGIEGHAIFWASHVTKGGAGDLLRCLAVLGLSRGEWRTLDNGNRQASLSDLDGEIRGDVLVSAEGASARLDYVLPRPLACLAA
jgi:hypothetical protein